MTKQRIKRSTVIAIGITALAIVLVQIVRTRRDYGEFPRRRLAEISSQRGGVSELRRECAQLLSVYENQGKEIWERSDNLPEFIGRLEPQCVQIRREVGMFVVDIQLSSGFIHRGLLVVVNNLTENAVPSKDNYRVTLLEPGIYQYVE